MTARADIVAAARSLLDTPYRAHARIPGPHGGVDCIGVPIVTSWIAELKPRSFDIQGYSMRPDGSMLPLCDELMTRIARAEMLPGDCVVVRYGKEPHHIGMLGDYRHGGLSIIHAENYRHNRVVEHRLSFGMGDPMEFVRAYRLPGVEA